MNDLPTKPYRTWINQPSTLQAYHYLHGQHVLVSQQGSVTYIYFLKGDVISQLIDPLALFKEGDVISQLIDPLALSKDGVWPPV